MGTKSNFDPPPRWLHCPRKGQIIIDKFLPFKTPLDSRYDAYVPEECRFTFDMLLQSIKPYKKTLGLIVDLTNTKRFYNSKDVKAKGCKYVKMQCTGHDKAPSREETTAFIQVCARFINQKPLEIIGVHCTHGYNRTGFLIVAYLVEDKDWSIDAAVQEYAKARPPGIYKQDYIYELFSRYGDVNDAPPAPLLPDWCDETEKSVDDDRNEKAEDGTDQQGKKKRFKAEVVKVNAKFVEGVSNVRQVLQQPTLGNIQKKVQDMCNWKSPSFPGSQPVPMNMQNIDFLRKRPYKCSWKADGTRFMMLIDGPNHVYMLDRDNTVFHVPNLNFPKRKDLTAHIFDTLLDGEMIKDMVKGQNVPRYLIYDIIKFEGQEVGKTDFSRRLLCIEKEIIGARNTKVLQGLLDKTKEPFSVRAKPFWDVVTARKILDGHFANQVSHEVDGLIFQPIQDHYCPGHCPAVLKWKPPSLNSVDCRLVIQNEAGGEGMLKRMRSLLYVTGMDEHFAEIKYTRELKDLDKKIIECTFDPVLNSWKYLRERTDKSFPNDYTTATEVERWMPREQSSATQMPPPTHAAPAVRSAQSSHPNPPRPTAPHPAAPRPAAPPAAMQSRQLLSEQY